MPFKDSANGGANAKTKSGLPSEVGEMSSGCAEPTETTMHMRSVVGIRPGRMSTVDLLVALEAVYVLG